MIWHQLSISIDEKTLFTGISASQVLGIGFRLPVNKITEVIRVFTFKLYWVLKDKGWVRLIPEHLELEKETAVLSKTLLPTQIRQVISQTH